MERAFNNRRGIGRRDDRLALTREMRAGGRQAEEEKRHRALLDAYYASRGYDPESGRPTEETLRRQGLSDVARAMAAEGVVAPWDGPALWPPDRYPSGGCRV